MPEPAKVEPVCIGPTWQRDPDHPTGWAHPKATIGWSALYWVSQWLQLSTGQPWVPTPEQERFILWWYAVDDTGRFLYRDGVLQRIKGWGKDPLGAVLCAIEFVGPSRYDHDADPVEDLYGCWHPAGMAHPEAWVQTAAVSQEQTKNTMTLFPLYFSKAAIAEYELDIGKQIIYAHKGAQRIEAVTSSPKTLEGARSTFVLRNETHHWLSSNEGWEMDAVIDRNLTKAPDGAARALSITNAYEPGEDSVAQIAREAYEDVISGKAVDVGVLYDSLEAPPEATLDPRVLPATLEAIRGDSTWLDIPRIVQSILDKKNPASRSRRFWLNQIVATEDAWVTPQEWDVLADKSIQVAQGDQITLGFDGSKSDDHAALMGCRIPDGYVFTIGVWDPESPEYAKRPQRFRSDIDAAVRQAFSMYDVVGFFSDVHPWESHVATWDAELGRDRGHELCVAATRDSRIGWDMRARQKEFTLSGAERTHDEIREKAFRHDGHLRTRQHVSNARNRPNAWGTSFGKEHRESNRKIDALPALILARMARKAYLGLPERKRRRKRRGAAFF